MGKSMVVRLASEIFECALGFNIMRYKIRAN